MVQRVIFLIVVLVLASCAHPRTYGGVECPIPGQCILSAGASPDAGTFTVVSPNVAYGALLTARTPISSHGSVPAIATLTIPSNTTGPIDVVVSCNAAGDASANGGSGAWHCGTHANGGSCVTYAACAATTAWAATDGGIGWSVGVGMADGGACTLIVSVAGTGDAGVIDCVPYLQFAGAQ